MSIQLLALLCCTATAPSFAQGRIWTIDPSGAGDFTEIAQGVAAIGAGDTLFVRPGSYSQGIVIDRAVSIVADGTGPVMITTKVMIDQVGASSDVFLSGLELMGGFRAQTCAGPVTFQECRTPATTPHDVFPGVNYDQFSDCNIGQSLHEVVGCRGVSLVDCEFHGAAGRQGDWGTYDGYPGHHALTVEDSDIALYGCTLVGGDGGDGWSSHFAVFAGAGGNGLFLRDATSTARIVNVSTSGGAGGRTDPNSAHNGQAIPGCDGQPIVARDPSAVEPPTHPNLTFDAPRILRGGLPRDIAVHGPPGARVILIASREPGWRRLPAAVGILHMTSPVPIAPLGTIPASGSLTWPLGSPSPNATNEFGRMQLQVTGFVGGTRFLSEPRQVVVLDPMF